MKKNLTIVFFSLFLALFIAEVVLRLIGVDQVRFQEKPRLDWVNVPEKIWVEYHPILGWYAQKNKTALLRSTHFPDVEVHTNSAGFRGTREYAVEKLSGVIRMAALGDSFVFGFGVKDTETFPAVLESQNNTREVLNLGVPGYGLDQIYLSYREIAKKYHPDIVIIGIFPEDFWRCTRSFADSGHVKPYFSLSEPDKLSLHNVPVPPQYSLNTNQFPDLFKRNLFQRGFNHFILFRLAKRVAIKLAKNMRLIDPDNTAEWLVGRAILSQWIQEIRTDKAFPVLVLMPPQDWARGSRKTSLERSLIRFAEREKIDLINLHPVFTEAAAKEGLETYYIKDDWHWTAKGHALAAEAIEKYFNQKR